MTERTVEEDLKMWQGMYLSRMRSHLDLAVKTLRLASEGRWADLVEYAGTHLDNCDGWQEEDTPIFQEAKRRALDVAPQPVLGIADIEYLDVV